MSLAGKAMRKKPISGFLSFANFDKNRFSKFKFELKQNRGSVFPKISRPVETLSDLLADAQVPGVEDIILEGRQLDHHVLVLPENVFSTLFVANLHLNQMNFLLIL